MIEKILKSKDSTILVLSNEKMVTAFFDKIDINNALKLTMDTNALDNSKIQFIGALYEEKKTKVILNGSSINPRHMTNLFIEGMHNYFSFLLILTNDGASNINDGKLASDIKIINPSEIMSDI